MSTAHAHCEKREKKAKMSSCDVSSGIGSRGQRRCSCDLSPPNHVKYQRHRWRARLPAHFGHCLKGSIEVRSREESDHWSCEQLDPSCRLPAKMSLDLPPHGPSSLPASPRNQIPGLRATIIGGRIIVEQVKLGHYLGALATESSVCHRK